LFTAQLGKTLTEWEMGNEDLYDDEFTNDLNDITLETFRLGLDSAVENQDSHLNQDVTKLTKRQREALVEWEGKFIVPSEFSEYLSPSTEQTSQTNQEALEFDPNVDLTNFYYNPEDEDEDDQSSV